MAPNDAQARTMSGAADAYVHARRILAPSWALAVIAAMGGRLQALLAIAGHSVVVCMGGKECLDYLETNGYRPLLRIPPWHAAHPRIPSPHAQRH